MFPIKPPPGPAAREAAIRAADERRKTHEAVEAMRAALTKTCIEQGIDASPEEIVAAAEDLVAAGWRLTDLLARGRR